MNAPGVAAVLILLSTLLARPAGAAPVVRVYLFFGETCSACAREEAFLDGLRGRLPGFEILAFEATRNDGNARLMIEAAAALGVEANAVPVTIVGASEPIVGFRDDATTGRVIEERVRRCLASGCEDPVAPLVASRVRQGSATRAVFPPGGGARAPAPAATGPAGNRLERLPLAALAVVLGALDGFNPCAFFVLFTLLGIMVHARTRRRMVLVGGTFVLFSGLVYFLFMAAWLNLFLHLGAFRLVTAAAGCIALAVGAINVKDYFFFKRGVSLTIPDSGKPRLFQRMRSLLAAASVPAALAGTAVLALAANGYELLCTAGFPMMFTRILTLNDLGPAAYYGYLALYNVVYVLPLLAVVAAFALSLGSRKLTEAQGRAMKLVSGLMMLGLGVVVLVDPAVFHKPLAGVGLLAGALFAAAAIHGVERRRRASSLPPAGGRAAPGAGGGLRRAA